MAIWKMVCKDKAYCMKGKTAEYWFIEEPVNLKINKLERTQITMPCFESASTRKKEKHAWQQPWNHKIAK